MVSLMVKQNQEPDFEIFNPNVTRFYYYYLIKKTSLRGQAPKERLKVNSLKSTLKSLSRK